MNNKIIIIGAGASGIACATKLYKHGFKNIQILEAENRIGGRINTVPYGANVVDMGGQWCQKGNAVYEMAQKHNFLEADTFDKNNINMMKSNGEEFPKDIARKLFDLVSDIIQNNDDVEQTKSLGDFIQEKFYKAMQTEEYSNIDQDTAKQFLDFMQKYGNSIDAADSWFDISAKSYAIYKSNKKADQWLNWKDKGYITVLDLLMKKLPNPSEALPIEDKILFNKEVVKINWNTTVHSAVKVTCSDNTAYEADHVISTMSLGVLKERKDYMFEPALPNEKLYAIDGLILGTVDKIYLEFAEPFWEDKWAGISLIWNKEDLDEIRKDPNEAWLEDVFGFYPIDYQPNIVCGWISGKNARIMESLPEHKVRKGVIGLLRRFLEKPSLPDPISMKRSQWYTNPHFRGSYTFPSIKSETLGFGPSHLAKPLTNTDGHPVVQFAGEATHDAHFSTAHGAIESGWREAKRILDLYMYE